MLTTLIASDGLTTVEKHLAKVTRTHGQWVRAAVDEFEGPLIVYAYRVVHNMDLAREVVQDTFLKLCREDRNEIEDHLAPWLFRVCRNRALDVMRKEKRVVPLSDEAVRRQSTTTDGPANRVEQADEHAHILALLDVLPDNQQEVIRLKFQHGLSYKEIADVTGLTTGYIGYLIHMGIKAIREKAQPQTPTSTSIQSTNT